MFKPELKDTGWEIAPEVIFEITGENYKESERIFLNNYNYSVEEKKLSTLMNNSLMNIIWDSITISELENHFKKAISEEDSQLRLELDEGVVFGWLHYNRNNKINTFRFKINLKGGFSKC